MTLHRAALVAITALVFTCIGCAAPARVDTTDPDSIDPRAVQAFGGWDGAPIGWNELLSMAAEADIVIIGEQHGHPLGLEVAAALWDDLLARTVAAGLSLEFFERDEQSRIDDYLAGLTDEATFKRRTGRNSSNYPEAHRRMLEAARAASRPVHAANAPRPIVRLARREGFDRLLELTEEQRRLFRIPDLPPRGRYRRDFETMMAEARAHAHGVDADDPEARARMVEGMMRSQSLWDWTMAHTIARAVQDGHVPLVHVVGRFHSDFSGGLMQALDELAPHARTLTISMADAWAEQLQEDDAGRADVIVYVGPASP